MPKWAPVFASMLVKIAFEQQGKVENCEIVMGASNKYRHTQDHIAGFVQEMIESKEGCKPLGKQEITEEFKRWFHESQGNSKLPSGRELCEYMDKKFGKYSSNKKSRGWSNIQIVKQDRTDALEELDEDD